MPRDASVSKVAAVEAAGCSRESGRASRWTRRSAWPTSARESTGAALVHPFDDLDVIAGQGTLALELLQDVPDLARVVVPVGGGGLASGIGIALRRAGAEVELVGVQAQRVRAVRAGAEGRRVPPAPPTLAAGATIADGIAIKRPGALTLPLLRELLRRASRPSTEDEIADAMVFLAERAKLVAEGAGAVAVAALRSGRLGAGLRDDASRSCRAATSTAGCWRGLLRRHETEEGRRVRIFTRVPDRPGGLAELLELVAGARANLAERSSTCARRCRCTCARPASS